MADKRKMTARNWASLGIFFAWAALFGVLVFVLLGYLQRFGSDDEWAIVSGTAHVESCESSWYGPAYTCEATFTWTDPAVHGSEHTQDVQVHAERALSGDVAVERRVSHDRKASQYRGQVYAADYPVRSYVGLTGVGLFLAFVVSLVIPGKLMKRFVSDKKRR